MNKNILQSSSDKFDNQINVIDATGKYLTPSYLHRAKGLVKNGRAKWVDEKTIRIINDASQDKKLTFHEYLIGKGIKPAYIEKSMALANQFLAMHTNDLPTAKSITDFLKSIWSGGLEGNGKGAGLGAEQEAYRFLDEYAMYSGDSSVFSVAYCEHIKEVFEQPAKKAVGAYKKAIRIIPDDVIVDPYYLDGLSNDEYVTAFKALQELISGIYDEIERTSPYEWGWQGWKDKTTTGGSYGVWNNRIMGIIGAFAEVGYLENDILIVSKKAFLAHDIAFKKHRFTNKGMADMIVTGLMDMGLMFEGYDNKKENVFTVSCPDSPNLMTVLFTYFKERRRGCCRCHKADIYPCMENCEVTFINHHKHIFSYRFVEKHPPQTLDTDILLFAIMDSAPEELRKIHRYLHEEALKHGYKIEPWNPVAFGALNYRHFIEHWGSKMWLPVRCGTSWEDFFYKQSMGEWTIKTEFKRVIKKHPDKADAFAKKFSDSFNLDAGSFVIQNPTLEDIKTILDLYKLENNIKAC